MEKCWHDGISAAFVLDPLNFVKGVDGQYRPPVWQLDRLDEVNKALKVVQRVAGATNTEDMEAVSKEWGRYQLVAAPGQECMSHLTAREEVDLGNGKKRLQVASVADRVGYWKQFGRSFPWLAKAAERLLTVAVTTANAERNWSQWGLVCTAKRNQLALSTAEKLVFVRGNLQIGSRMTDRELSMRVMED